MVASAMARSSASPVHAWAVRRAALRFDQHRSMGDRSGDYGGKDSHRAPACSTAARLPATVCARRLSMITRAPERRVGRRICAPET
jgi:hypothetical protein